MATGIRARHARSCRSRGGGGCNCRPTYQAEVYSVVDVKKIRKSFPTEAAAKNWRQDAQVALRQGTMRASTPLTLQEAWDAWVEGAERGAVRNRTGDEYKPSAVRSYQRAMRLRVLPELGPRRLSELRRPELQDLIDGLVADGLAASTIQMSLVPLAALFRREVSRGRIPVNPTLGLELPAVRGGRDRIADPKEAAALIAAVPEEDRALWATALYAGLRRGELRALRVSRIDLTENVIHVHKGWDDKAGEIETKGRNRRRVPIASELREHLLSHLMRTGRRGRGDALVFGRTDATPFAATTVTGRADEAWEDAEVARITLHECRHTFASLMIAAGCNAKALSTYMGHAGISITLDRYGHLMPGNEDEAAGLLDSYLTRATAEG